MATDCFHCGLSIDKSLIFSKINKQDQPMCCYGCKAVCETILSHGQGKYYQYRTETANTPLQSTVDYTQYDTTAVQASFCQSIDNIHTEASVIIEGIHCAACTWLIENALNTTHGIDHINVSLSDHSATIRWNNNVLPLSHVFNILAGIGYTAHPYTPNIQQNLYQQEKKKHLKRLGLAGIAMMQVGMFSIALYAGDFQGIAQEYQTLIRSFSLLITTAVLLYAGHPFFSGAWRSIKSRRPNMDTPIAIALSAAFSASVWGTLFHSEHVYFDSICMLIFFLLLARFFELSARNRYIAFNHHTTIPSTCKRLTFNSETSEPLFEVITTESAAVGDTVLVLAGETIPADGIITEGVSAVDESSVTGEFQSLHKQKGDKVLAGALNSNGRLLIKISAIHNQSSIHVIQKLLSKSQQQKPTTVSLAEKVARRFTSFVLISTILTGIFWGFVDSTRVLNICIAMLVVSCPCALSLATPTALAIGGNLMRKMGLLICQGDVLEKAKNIQHVIFDKTGSLTQGALFVIKQHTFNGAIAHRNLQIASLLEAHSEHPIAKAFSNNEGTAIATNVVVTSNLGIKGTINGEDYRIGSQEFCRQWITTPPTASISQACQTIWLVNRTQWLAAFELDDQLREDAKSTVEHLKNLSLSVQILTGDPSNAGPVLAKQLGINDIQCNMNPAQKLVALQSLQAKKVPVMMIGDGINDIPVLAGADISIALNNASDLAKVEADCILLNNQLSLITVLIEQSKRTYKIIKQNMAWALAYNLTALPLAAMGFVPPYLAAIGMSISSLVVVLNATRLNATTFTNSWETQPHA